jgi:hypothetical protein
MRSRQVSGRRARWGEVLLGSLAGFGVPVLLRGVNRGQRRLGSPVTMGAVAGLLGALVGGGLARRRRVEPVPPEGEKRAKPEPRPAEPVAHPRAPAEPRRGPSGRERDWLLQGAHT